MKFVFSIVAILAAVGTAIAATSQDDSHAVVHDPGRVHGTGITPLMAPFDEINLDMVSQVDSRIGKRAYYSCYNNSPASIAARDCEKVIANVHAYNRTVNVMSGLCATWIEGSCKASLCARMAGAHGLNETSEWIADQLTNPLLDSCARNGLGGWKAECSNVFGNCGQYRLWLKHA